MKRCAVSVFIILVLAGFAAIVRYDLAMLAWRQGNALLCSGNYQAAVAAFHLADGIPHPLPLFFNEGVALYRQGDFRQARSRFAAASAAADPARRAAVRYNLGNCAFRLGERLADSDRQGAHRLFQEAAAAYEQALAISPGATDARHNLAVVRARLAGPAGREGEGSRNRPQPSGFDRTATGAAGREKGEKGHSGDPSAARGRGTGMERENWSGRPDSPVHSEKGRPELTRDEAEHLLNEARGREALSAALPAKGGIGPAARPDRDW